MTEEQIREEVLRLTPFYTRIQQKYLEQSSLEKEIEHARLAIDYGTDLPDYSDPTLGEFQSSENCNVGLYQWLEVLLLVRKDRNYSNQISKDSYGK